MIREGFKTKEVMVVIVTNGEKLPKAETTYKSILEKKS